MNAIAAILLLTSTTAATTLCDVSQPSCAGACAHPRTVAGFSFDGSTTGRSNFTVDGKTSRILCFQFQGSTDTATVVYDEIFNGAFEP